MALAKRAAAPLLLAGGLTAYILAAIPLEERDLAAALGADYGDCRRRVPALMPRLSSAERAPCDEAAMEAGGPRTLGELAADDVVG